MRAKTVFNRTIEQQIDDLKLKIMHARAFHPEKIDMYIDQLRELEGDIPKNKKIK